MKKQDKTACKTLLRCVSVHAYEESNTNYLSVLRLQVVFIFFFISVATFYARNAQLTPHVIRNLQNSRLILTEKSFLLPAKVMPPCGKNGVYNLHGPSSESLYFLKFFYTNSKFFPKSYIASIL